MTKITGSQVLADMIDGYGISHIFMVPAVLRRTMAELERRTDIKRLHVHSEKSAAYMADGYARAAKKPGLCMAQTVGALNLAAGLRDAHLSHSPVVAFTGGRHPETKFRTVYQEVDDLPAFDNVTKFNATVDDVNRIPDMVRHAFRTAVSGTPGPVHLEFQGNEGQIDQQEINTESFVEKEFSVVPPIRPEPDKALVSKAVDLLQTALKPVIVAGGGAHLSNASAEIIALAEQLSIPVATSLTGKDIIPATHPLSVGVVGTYSRGSANRVVNEASLICYIGSATGGMTTHFWQVPPIGTPTIQIDLDPTVLGRNYPLQVGIFGDAKITMMRMLELANGDSANQRKSWIARASKLNEEWKSQYTDLLTSDATPIRPERICHELTKHAPDDAIMVVDTGHAGMWMGGMYDIRTREQNYIRCAGHLGWAFPAGLGAKCACPDRPVISFTGDAGFWYHIAEIETAVRWNINAITIVNNNSAGNQSKRGFDQIYGGVQTQKARELWTFTEVNFALLAEQIGAIGIRVEKPSELSGAIEQAISLNRPVIIDVVTDIDALAPQAVI
ncbi:thiamine pyrophosphate-binding protein [Pseudomonadota bacterium]